MKRSTTNIYNGHTNCKYVPERCKIGFNQKQKEYNLLHLTFKKTKRVHILK